MSPPVWLTAYEGSDSFGKFLFTNRNRPSPLSLIDGPITVLTWALEIGEVSRFHSLRQIISYAGLCSDECSSADVQQRLPLSKQWNQHLNTLLIEPAHMVPYWSPELNQVYQQEQERGRRNRAA